MPKPTKIHKYQFRKFPKGVAPHTGRGCGPSAWAVAPSRAPSPTSHSIPAGLVSAARSAWQIETRRWTAAMVLLTDRTSHRHWLMRDPVQSAGCTRKFLSAGSNNEKSSQFADISVNAPRGASVTKDHRRRRRVATSLTSFPARCVQRTITNNAFVSSRWPIYIRRGRFNYISLGRGAGPDVISHVTGSLR